jgi:predicted solute-binding protein
MTVKVSTHKTVKDGYDSQGQRWRALSSSAQSGHGYDPATCNKARFKTLEARFKIVKARSKTVNAIFKMVKARFKTVKARFKTVKARF